MRPGVRASGRPCISVEIYSTYYCRVVTANVKLFKSLQPAISGRKEDKHNDLSVQGTEVSCMGSCVRPSGRPSVCSLVHSLACVLKAQEERLELRRNALIQRVRNRRVTSHN